MEQNELLRLLTQAKGVIAIDGRSASGKTTLAGIISSVTHCPLIHTDDFFLPEEKRTAERLSEPGGNIDYERFYEEVIKNLGSDFSYRRFSCEKMDFDGEVKIKKSPLIIVEGSYSHHPFFGDYADIKVFADVEKEEQLKRIIKRNGREKAEIFRTKWIPLEEKYFSFSGIKEKSDYIFTL